MLVFFSLLEFILKYNNFPTNINSLPNQSQSSTVHFYFSPRSTTHPITTLHHSFLPIFLIIVSNPKTGTEEIRNYNPCLTLIRARVSTIHLHQPGITMCYELAQPLSGVYIYFFNTYVQLEKSLYFGTRVITYIVVRLYTIVSR
jgi:hypothetical protein